MLAAAIAFGLMRQGRSRDRAVELALHAMEDRALYEADNGLFWMAAILALANADHPDTPVLWAETLAHAHRNGSLFSQLSMSLWDGAFKLSQGELAEAEELLRTNLVEAELYGLKVEQAAAYTFGFLGGVLLERGDLAGAGEAIAQGPVADGDRSDGAQLRPPDARSGSSWPRPTASARWRLAEDYERHAEPARNPAWVPWRSLKAQALALLGSPRGGDRPRAARRSSWRASGARPRGWAARSGFWASCSARTAWRSSRRPPSCSRCRASGSSARGRSRRSAPSCAARGAPRTRASRCGARSRSARSPGRRRSRSTCARSSTPPAPGRARRRSGGVESLTERELRVATLAADGQTNRDIAQALYVTPKTVEVHLSNAYRKLDIASRRELPAALTPSAP